MPFEERDSSANFYYSILMFVEGMIVAHSLVFGVEFPAAVVMLGWPFFRMYFFYDNTRMLTRMEITCALLGIFAGIFPASQLYPIIGEKVAAIAERLDLP